MLEKDRLYCLYLVALVLLLASLLAACAVAMYCTLTSSNLIAVGDPDARVYLYVGLFTAFAFVPFTTLLCMVTCMLVSWCRRGAVVPLAFVEEAAVADPAYEADADPSVFVVAKSVDFGIVV